MKILLSGYHMRMCGLGLTKYKIVNLCSVILTLCNNIVINKTNYTYHRITI